jgi:hypothetical protein
MYVEGAQRFPPAPPNGGPPTLTLTPLIAMLDQADAGDASLLTRLCALTAFTRAADEAFAELAPGTNEPLRELVSRHAAVVRAGLSPAMAARRLSIVRWNQLRGRTREPLADVFRRRIYPALTPLAVDSTHPFPQPASLSLNLAVTVLDRRRDVERFLTMTVPNSVPRLLTVGAGRFLPVEDLIAAHLGEVFPGTDIRSVRCFRVTRARGRGLTCAQRLELESSMDEGTAAALRHGFAVDRSATYLLNSSVLIGPTFASLIPLVPESPPLRQLAAVSSERTTSAARAATASDPRGAARHRRPRRSPRAPAANAAKAG